MPWNRRSSHDVSATDNICGKASFVNMLIHSNDAWKLHELFSTSANFPTSQEGLKRWQDSFALRDAGASCLINSAMNNVDE